MTQGEDALELRDEEAVADPALGAPAPDLEIAQLRPADPPRLAAGYALNPCALYIHLMYRAQKFARFTPCEGAFRSQGARGSCSSSSRIKTMKP